MTVEDLLTASYKVQTEILLRLSRAPQGGVGLLFRQTCINLVELVGLEPTTSALQVQRSPN